MTFFHFISLNRSTINNTKNIRLMQYSETDAKPEKLWNEIYKLVANANLS